MDNRLPGHDAGPAGIHPLVPLVTVVAAIITFLVVMGANPHPNAVGLISSAIVGSGFGFFTWLLTR